MGFGWVERALRQALTNEAKVDGWLFVVLYSSKPLLWNSNTYGTATPFGNAFANFVRKVHLYVELAELRMSLTTCKSCDWVWVLSMGIALLYDISG